MNINQSNLEAIIVLCSHLCTGDGVAPYESTEGSRLATLLYSQNIQPYELLIFAHQDFKEKLSFEEQAVVRIERLIARSASISFEIQRYAYIGIQIVTRADTQYQLKLKKALGKSCPPLFYYAGDLNLANRRMIRFVGSRTVSQDDINFTVNMVSKVLGKGYSVISGGVKGVDSISTEESLKLGGFAIEYISDSFLRKLKNNTVVNSVRNGQLLILSISKPDAGFNTGLAMMRNRYIYVGSVGTVVVRSDLKKGGTWAGATENLRHQQCPEFCWNNPLYDGNMELIKQGAIPVDFEWDVDVDILSSRTDNRINKFPCSSNVNAFLIYSIKQQKFTAKHFRYAYKERCKTSDIYKSKHVRKGFI